MGCSDRWSPTMEVITCGCTPLAPTASRNDPALITISSLNDQTRYQGCICSPPPPFFFASTNNNEKKGNMKTGYMHVNSLNYEGFSLRHTRPAVSCIERRIERNFYIKIPGGGWKDGGELEKHYVTRCGMQFAYLAEERVYFLPGSSFIFISKGFFSFFFFVLNWDKRLEGEKKKRWWKIDSNSRGGCFSSHLPIRKVE